MRQTNEEYTYLNEYYKKKVEEFKQENKKLSDRKKIVLLGDSITEFFPVNMIQIPNHDFITRGSCGDTTFGIYNRLDVSVFDIGPKMVFIMAGINDINIESSFSLVLGNFYMIIGAIKSRLPDCQVIILSVLCKNKNTQDENYSFDINKTIIMFNKELSRLAISSGVKYTDINSLMIDKNDDLILKYSDDGVHPNILGYNVFAKELQKNILIELSKQSR